MTRPVIVLGGGGHAKVLIDALRQSDVAIIGIADPDEGAAAVLGVPVIGTDAAVLDHTAGAVDLVNGIGSAGRPTRRRDAFRRFAERGYRFATVIHPSAIIGAAVVLGDGAQIMAGAVVQPGTRIGANVIVNTRAAVDHDCRIGDHVHLAPGVTLSGGVVVGESAHVGVGATVIQGIAIGGGAVIAGGAVVISDVPENGKVAGVPARAFV